MENVFHRVSIRKYEDKAVEKEKIIQILKAGNAGSRVHVISKPGEF